MERFQTIVFFLFLSSSTVFAQETNAKPQPQPTWEDATIAFESLMFAADPKSEGNNYWPTTLKKRMQWVLDEYSAKRLDIVFVRTFADCHNCIMESGHTKRHWWKKRRPFIAVSLIRFAELIRYEYGIPPWQELTHGRKPTLLLPLYFAHETIHLDNKKFWKQPRSKQELLDEEIRAWYVESVQITLLLWRKVFDDVPENFTVAFANLAACGYRQECLRALMEANYPHLK